jgi:flagellar protein FlaG
VIKNDEGLEPAPRATPPPEEQTKPTPVESFKPYSLSFRFEEELNRVVVKVIDPETGEAIREIPPESVIEALKQLKNAPGNLVL